MLQSSPSIPQLFLSATLPYRRLPILIGLTGKAEFRAREDVADEASAKAEALDAFRRRWTMLVRWLDCRLSFSPKVLMIGGDIGADLMAAEIVLAMDAGNAAAAFPLWSVVVVKAFSDFTPRTSAAAKDYARLEAGGRLKTLALRYLAQDPFDDRVPDADLGMPEMPAGMDGDGDTDRARFRGHHFDQLGYWLARQSTLFVAAAPANSATTPKQGSVDRAVAFRRAALVDEKAAEMLERSRELLSGSALEDPDAGHVFWIDMTPGAADRPAEHPFTLLRPMTLLYEQHGAGRDPNPADAPKAGARLPIDTQRQRIFAAPFKEYACRYPVIRAADEMEITDRALATPLGKRLARAMAVAHGIERFHRRQLLWLPMHGLWWRARLALAETLRLTQWRDRLQAGAVRTLWGDSALDACDFSMGQDEGPAEFLSRVRSGLKKDDLDKLPGVTAADAKDVGESERRMPLDRQQSSLAEWTRWIMRATTAVAFMAVAALEAFTELFPDKWWFLGLYLACLFLIAGAVMFASAQRLNQLNEDMRGVKEILRVQIAWWQIGINRMVDRVHLRAIDSDLTVIREISATIAMWARLRASPGALLSGEADLAGLNAAAADLSRPGQDPFAVQQAAARLSDHARKLRAGIERALNDWVVAQANYYRNNGLKQRQFVLFAEQMTSMAFGVSLLMLLALLGLHFSTETLTEHMAWLQEALPIPAAAWREAGISLWLVILLVVAKAAIYHQTHQWRLLPAALSGRYGIRRVFVLLAAVGAIWLMTSPLRPLSYLWSIPAALTAAGLAGAWLYALPEDSKLWRVPELSVTQRVAFAAATAAGLMGVDFLLSPGLAAIRTLLEPNADAAHGLEEAVRSLVMVSATLSLAATTLLKYYVEKRNHKAQFAEYSNQNRAFLRCRNTLKARLADCERRTDRLINLAGAYKAGEPTEAITADADAIRSTILDLRRLSIELGELALDENETWLQAHRERPLEAIAGGG